VNILTVAHGLWFGGLRYLLLSFRVT